MNISRSIRAAVVAAAVGVSVFVVGTEAVHAVPLDPPPTPAPAPGGSMQGPAPSAPQTTNIPRPGVGPGGAHGGQNQTKAPEGSS